MRVDRQTNDILTFDHEGLGKFEVELNNATIVKLSFMANGLPEKGQLIGTDRKFLEAVHKSLGELLSFLNEGLGSIPPPIGNAPKEQE
jgi:hypothetical protein